MSSWLGEWPSSSRTFKAAVYLFWAVLACVTFAFATPYWLVSVPDEELPNPKFTNLGEIDHHCTKVELAFDLSLSLSFNAASLFRPLDRLPQRL